MPIDKKRIRGWVEWRGLLLLLVPLAGLVCTAAAQDLDRIRLNSVCIAAYFSITPAAEYIVPETYPVSVTQENGWRVIVGGGTILKNGYILTVGHLVFQGNREAEKIYVFLYDNEKIFMAKIIAWVVEPFEDYAVIKIDGAAHKSGVKISPVEPKEGDNVVWIGTPKKHAFLMRFGCLSVIDRFFGVRNGILMLKNMWTFPFWGMTPGMSGDSGGGVFNEAGQLVSVIYLKKDIDSHGFVLANPNGMLWSFLKTHKLEYLGK